MCLFPEYDVQTVKSSVKVKAIADKECDKKCSWPDLRLTSGISLEFLHKGTVELSHIRLIDGFDIIRCVYCD